MQEDGKDLEPKTVLYFNYVNLQQLGTNPEIEIDHALKLVQRNVQSGTLYTLISILGDGTLK